MFNSKTCFYLNPIEHRFLDHELIEIHDVYDFDGWLAANGYIKCVLTSPYITIYTTITDVICAFPEDMYASFSINQHQNIKRIIKTIITPEKSDLVRKFRLCIHLLARRIASKAFKPYFGFRTDFNKVFLKMVEFWLLCKVHYFILNLHVKDPRPHASHITCKEWEI